jgi:hypothetical protein
VIASSSLAVYDHPSMFYAEREMETYKFLIGIKFKNSTGTYFFKNDANLLTAPQYGVYPKKDDACCELAKEAKVKRNEDKKLDTILQLYNYVANGNSKIYYNEVGCICESITDVDGLFIYSDTSTIDHDNLNIFCDNIRFLMQFELPIYYVWNTPDGKKQWKPILPVH